MSNPKCYLWAVALSSVFTSSTYGWCAPPYHLWTIKKKNGRGRASRIFIPLYAQRRRQTNLPDPFLEAMLQLGYSAEQQNSILTQLTASGLWEDSSLTLQAVTRDFLHSGAAAISTLLMQDFGISPVAAHQTRAALHHLATQSRGEPMVNCTLATNPYEDHEQTHVEVAFMAVPVPSTKKPKSSVTTQQSYQTVDASLEQGYKASIVSKAAQRRAGDVSSTFEYGLSRDFEEVFPITAAELTAFFKFMTVPSTDSQGETPIRAATANIYLRLAKLFLGWYWDYYLPEQGIESQRNKDNLSVYKIFPTKEKESAASILEFVLWLRSTRQISVSYEANMLRGLSKLLKFRFRKESCDDDSDTSFGDIPVIRELRKLHRDANRRQAVAPRVSNEDRKWLSWPEYLQVIQRTRKDLRTLINEFNSKYSEQDVAEAPNNCRPREIYQRRVACAFQKYLILAFFASVPDRQRTIRELEIGRSFVKDGQNQWFIKHAPEDYKTGRTYGERPPLHLPTTLTNDIDEFIERWRPALSSLAKSDRVVSNIFLQVRTGNPLTSDSVYHSVAKTCYHYTGKRTNPHLLRDMIVTHVRESSDASEKQLEALALFMGHSPAIQRKSYDRRTLTTKVAPAVALMEQVNAESFSRL